MTSYMPHLTLPAKLFSEPAIAILMPIALGTAVGLSISRKQNDLLPTETSELITFSNSKINPENLPCSQAATSRAAIMDLRPGMDRSIRSHGLLSV
jgi:hypothetical protein